MERLLIVSSGENEKVQANARGKLFENIIAEVLRHYGYEIDRHRINVTYAGMEIDIEGKTRITSIPLYSECKCYRSEVNSEEFIKFFGKYMSQWLKDNKCHGLFVAIPGVNSHAMGFYRENCEKNCQITVRLLQEPEVLDTLIESRIVISSKEVEKLVNLEIGSPGDNLLICSDKGYFWVQYIIPIGAGIASKIQLFDSHGHTITDKDTIDYLGKLVPEIGDLEIIEQSIETKHRFYEEPTDEIVEIRGGSTCFEYQFPAYPEFFFGRDEILVSIEKFVSEIIENKISNRGILFEANSGWGKSSLVLKTVSRILENGHYAVAIDSRSASTSLFLLKTVQHVIDRFSLFNGAPDEKPVIGGFDGAIRALLKIGDALKQNGKLLFIFFDQFENVFYLQDVLAKIAQICLKITDKRTNIVLGFSWKTDLVGITREFPYKLRDIIIDTCQVFRLKQFSEVEINAILDRLGEDLHTTLRKDLRFFLSEFSQGYPWLLKKLCAHVKNQRNAGIAQSEIARGLLNVEQLFHEDIDGLTSEQDEALRRIAQLAPVSIPEIGEEFSTDIIQSLVNRRLIVKVGAKYDIYWDIFRDYLNTGKLPIEQVYLIRAQVGSILNAIQILHNAGDKLNTKSFKEKSGLSDGAYLNIVRDLRILQLAKVEEDSVSLFISSGFKDSEIIRHLKDHLRDKLPRNRCVHNVLKILKEKGEINIEELAVILKYEFPYISAVKKTWETYARVLATWLDFSDLSVFDQNNYKISEYKVGSQIRDRSLSFASKRSKITVPLIHFIPIVQVAIRVVSAARKNENIDCEGISRSTIYKSLSMLEELSLISRKSNMISVTPECYIFALDPDRRGEIARQSSLNWPIFKTFIEILNENVTKKLSHLQLGKALVERCKMRWKPETAKTNAKIMLDWARHLNLAPGVHKHSRRGRFKLIPSSIQFSLFDSEDKNNKVDLQQT